MYWSLENVPWTNLHDLNLDWIVNTMKETVEQWIAYRIEMNQKYEDFTTQINEDFDAFTTQINEWKTQVDSDFADLQQYVQNYFDNLDLNESTRYVINQMIASGEFIQVLNPSIVSTTEAWLASHVTPTSPVVDDTLTISGAAADAKVTGDRFNSLDLLNAYNYLNDSNLNDTNVDGGLTFTYDRSKNEINITGNKTTTSSVNHTFFLQTGSLPGRFKAGETYYFSYDGVNSFLRVYDYSSTSSIPVLLQLQSGKNVPLTLPNNCTGLIIRVYVLANVTGAVNETCHPLATDSLSNQDITDLICDGGHVAPLKFIKTYVNGDANEFKERGYTFVSYTNGGTNNWINTPQQHPGWIFNFGPNDGAETSYTLQLWVPYAATPAGVINSMYANIYIRRLTPDGWEPWHHFYNTRNLFISATEINHDANNLIGNLAFVSVSGSGPDVSNIPYNQPQFLLSLAAGREDVPLQIQFSFPYATNQKIWYRVKSVEGSWSSWVELDTGGSSTTIIQEVSRDTYNNTYNITTSPQITTDSNGWLQAVDTNTASETNKTDMTGAIMSMLNSTGYCHLGPGIFYVSGNINMPANSMIEGCGKQTIIRLLQSTTSGYIIRMHTRSTLKNVCLSGGYNDGDISNGNIGGRKGINYIGNRDGQNPGVTPSTCTLCMIEGCWFENLDSGIYGYNSGGGLQDGLEVSNCYFTRCKAGINLDYWVEYCKFTNCIMFQCYYACINNGGNNVFTACTFNGVIGFVIDNSADNKTNNAHGSCIGCTFNHIDRINQPSEDGKGIGIKVLNTIAGFLFANCQIWYGRIHIENSKGIQITGCEIGGLGDSNLPFLETSGSYMVFIDNCLFQRTPYKSTSSPTKFTNCWTYDGIEVN